ncbi:MAG: Flp pilus assembly protein CpaB [Gemmataceae bacterium]
MSIRTVMVVLLALVCGGSSVVGINSMRGQDPAPAKVETVAVVVASAEIPRGTALTESQITTKDYPQDLVPTGALTKVEDVLGRTISIPVAKDEPLLESKLASKSAGRGLAALVPDGMRACTITTTVSSALAGMLLPGNRVDVLLSISSTGQTNDPTGGGSTTTLLQNVEILAIDHHIEAPTDNKVDANAHTVTLLVSPDQAALVELGQTRGTLHLTLRNPGDKKAANTRPATLNGIQFKQEKRWDERLKGLFEAVAKMTEAHPTDKPEEKKPEPAKPASVTVRTIRGTSEGSVLIEQPEIPAERP